MKERKEYLLTLIDEQEERLDEAYNAEDYELAYVLGEMLDDLEEEYQRIIIKENDNKPI